MLIVQQSPYIKPYITMCVGFAKFVYNNKHNVLIIMYEDVITIYRNGELLGQSIYGLMRIKHPISGVDDDSNNTEWNSRVICGWTCETPHNIPFYHYNNHISIFGFYMVQYMYDTIYWRNALAISIHERAIQI